MSASFTRRGFLNLVGAAGGSAAVYQMAIGLGMIPMVARADRPDIAPVGKQKRSVYKSIMKLLCGQLLVGIIQIVYWK